MIRNFPAAAIATLLCCLPLSGLRAEPEAGEVKLLVLPPESSSLDERQKSDACMKASAAASTDGWEAFCLFQCIKELPSTLKPPLQALSEEAAAKLAEARSQMAEMDYAGAQVSLQAAESVLLGSLAAHGEAPEMWEVLAYRGLAAHLSADAASAKSFFGKAVLFDERREPDPVRFPPEVLALFSETKGSLAAIPRVSVTIRGAPSAGTTLKIDGRGAGPLPATFSGILPGLHHLFVCAEHYEPWYSAVDIKPGTPFAMEVFLKPERTVQNAEALLREGRVDLLAEVFDAVVVLAMRQDGAFLSARFENPSSGERSASAVISLAGGLEKVDFAPLRPLASPNGSILLLPPPEIPQWSEEDRVPVRQGGSAEAPIYGKWWFWTAVGVAAAPAIAAAIVILAKDRDEDIGVAIRCGPEDGCPIP